MDVRRLFGMALLALSVPVAVPAQEREAPRWLTEGSLGYVGFVDDATKEFALAAGALRRRLSSRVSIGPELAVMWGDDAVRDVAVMLTGNVTVDLVATDSRDVRLMPFLVGGLGAFWGRDQVRGGPYWSSDPAFTGGGGVRVRLARRMAASVEYRIGWELHQRLSVGVSTGLD